MSTSVLVPNVDNITITPNPVSINTSFLISVKVSEITKVLEPESVYCGTLYCGQEFNL